MGDIGRFSCEVSAYLYNGYTMRYEEASWYSERLGRWMKIRIYGHYGQPVLAFPCQNQPGDDFANHGMIDALSFLIDSGRMKLYCLEVNDDQTVSDESWDHGKAAYLLEQYHHYVVEEVLPFVYDKQRGHCYPYLIGASMGGTHAANQFFRRPDLYSGFVSLSASYDVARCFHDYFDSNVYNNSPVHYLANMPSDHPYMDLYRHKTMCVVVGDGSFEYLVKYTNHWLADVTNRKGIPVWYNFWDQNSIHDWSSWLYQMPYFLDRIL